MPLLRRFLSSIAALLACLATGVAAAFGFDDVDAQARALAAAAPRPAVQAPAALQALSYDQARDIRFRPERALWRREGLPFEAMFFHLGHVQTQAVRLHEITPQGAVRPLAYDAGDFQAGPLAAQATGPLGLAGLGDVGYAGFRLHTALNHAAYKDELVVFQGASYFRALGAGQRYGLSARGLAIDTVGAAAEEFPRFSAFWLQQPAPGARSVVVLALLESARATGAYRFEITPGAETVTEVRARLYLRPGSPATAALGLAPLTSMFLFGENQPQAADFRPEVHDSDGLLIAGGDGEWIWRPLQNPRRPLVSSFAQRSPRGFGLMQRDRRFDAYEDTEAHYERRPSAWVEPIGDWGAGRVELVQLPTPDETHDNIVAYWVPERLPAADQALDFAYRLRWQGDAPTGPPGAWVRQTRSGRSYAALGAGEQQFIVDFNGPALAALPADATVQPVVSSSDNGELTEVNAYRHTGGDPARAGWRLSLRVRVRDPDRPVELRAFLRTATHTLSETWSHLIPAR